MIVPLGKGVGIWVSKVNWRKKKSRVAVADLLGIQTHDERNFSKGTKISTSSYLISNPHPITLQIPPSDTPILLFQQIFGKDRNLLKICVLSICSLVFCPLIIKNLHNISL